MTDAILLIGARPLREGGLAFPRAASLGVTALGLLALACAASVVLLALLCANRLYSAWDLGPDRLLFAEQLSRVGGKTPNRMAPNTALNFLSGEATDA